MVTKQHCINTNKVSRKFLRYNEFGFAIYSLTRTSDCYDQRTVNGVAVKQIAKYQVGQQYYLPDENPGWSKNPASTTVEMSEYLLTFCMNDLRRIQLIGRK